MMDGEEDYSANAEENTTKTQDANDMTFCINSYLKDAMKVHLIFTSVLTLAHLSLTLSHYAGACCIMAI